MSTPVLLADSISKWYGNRSVLTSAMLRADAGAVTALLGRNGAGKSTLLKICSGTITGDSGRIVFLGEHFETPRLHRLARKGFCFLPSERPLLSRAIPLGRQLAAIAAMRSRGRLDEVIDTLSLGNLIHLHPETLSGGEIRRASVASAWLMAPKCLLADEPLRGIAPIDEELIIRILRDMASEGTAVVVTGHQSETLLNNADQVIWAVSGTTRLLGPPEKARADWQFNREFLGG